MFGPPVDEKQGLNKSLPKNLSFYLGGRLSNPLFKYVEFWNTLFTVSEYFKVSHLCAPRT